MKFDITKLKSGIVEEIPVDLTYTFSKDQLTGTELLELNNVRIEGSIFINSADSYELHLVVGGVMVLPCAISLKPVDYPFDLTIDGDIERFKEEFAEITIKSENTIDIFPIIWENILMEIPMRVVSEDASLEATSGDGWRVITDQEESASVNPALQQLKDLLR